MQRHALRRLEQWAGRPGRKPLVIRGARQVGKSTLVRIFAERSGQTLHEINLERHADLGGVFASLDPDRILRELEYIADEGTIRDEKSLLFLDEIQAVPQAIPALRALHEERPQLLVVAAGSLLEFVLADHEFSMPVGRVEYLFLEPMGFQEFLAALGERSLLSLLREFQWVDVVPTSAHDRLLRRLRDYLLVGGMPEAVQAFTDTESLADVHRVHASILETYRDDFAKYGSRAEIARIRQVYSFVPGAIGEKFKYSRVDSDAPSRQVKRALELLVMARVVRRIVHSDATGIPLGSTLHERAFKTFFLDVGLVNTACGVSHLAAEEVAETRFVNEGAMAEQFIAQHLPLGAPEDRTFVPTYWIREGRANNAEVDFLIQSGNRIVPIEVKAGKSGRLKSLLEFMHLRRLDLAVRFDTSVPSRQSVSHVRTRDRSGDPTEFELLSLPLYLVEELPRLLS